MEVWMPIPEFVGLYEASSHGRIRTVERHVRNGEGSSRVLSSKIRATAINKKDGYEYTTLSVNRKCFSRKVHRLVASAFHGECPEGCVCCHNNGDKLDNRPENLRWDTLKSNSEDMLKHGTRKWCQNVPNSRWTDEQVGMVIRGEISSVQAMSRWGMQHSSYGSIRDGRCWKKHPARLGDGIVRAEDGRGKNQNGEYNPSSRFTHEQIAMILLGWADHKYALDVFGMSRNYFNGIRSGITWKNHPARQSKL